MAIDFDLSTGDQGTREIGRIRTGDTITFQLHLAQGELVTGWGCVIDYDPSALKYLSQSFTPSDLIPSILPLVAEKTGSVELGGTTLGAVSEVRGGYLGEVAFEVLDGFLGETELEIAEVTLRLAAGGGRSGRLRGERRRHSARSACARERVLACSRKRVPARERAWARRLVRAGA